VGRTTRRVFATLLCIAVVSPLASSASAATTDARRARRAIGYLRSVQRPNGSIPAFSPIGSTADAVLAVQAAGVGPGVRAAAIHFLRVQTEAGALNDPGLQAKVALAAAAAGRNPRAFGGHNLIGEIRSLIGPDGHVAGASVFDQALAVLAIETVGTPQTIVTDWLLDAQCPDGGWAFDAPFDPVGDDAHCDDGSGSDFFTSDTNTTSYVVQAVEFLDRDTYQHGPFAFFTALRDAVRGGWGYTAGFGTDTNSTALVLQAYAADGRPIPDGSRAALRRLQFPRCGAWAFTWNGTVKGDPDPGATIGAVPGLVLRPFPMVAAPPTALAPVPRTPAC
jgi:hypothetical protein